MRLSGLGLQNFKAFRDSDVRLAPLTILIGPNNAGKSTLLHALGILAQSVNTSAPTTRGPIIDLGEDWQRLTNVDVAKAGGPGWAVELAWRDEVRQRPGFAELSTGAIGLPLTVRFRYSTTSEVE